MPTYATRSGLRLAESLNSRRARMRAWKTKADKQAKRLERELKKIDRHLEVDFIDPEAANNPVHMRAPGVMPGRWHIIRRNPGAVDSYFALAGPNGEYRDLELAVVEEMKALDLWRPGALKAVRDREARAVLEQKQADETEAEGRVEQTAAALRAARRVPGDGGWKRSHARKRQPEVVKPELVLPPGVRRP